MDKATENRLIRKALKTQRIPAKVRADITTRVLTNGDFVVEDRGLIIGQLKASEWQPRKKNPAPRRTRGLSTAQRDQVTQAIKLYQRFRDQEPKFVDEYITEIPRVGMVVGKCAGVLYDTVRGGKKEKYIHEFSGKSMPLLCASYDGKQLFFVGGNYDFTQDGIKDRK